mmetsp:Transcript_4364/g.11154  ORF Transcript_4364/g.11154 Transcript_4364/m.11154 type:complete len:210 (+) Transcript_4364:60-689(+)
MTARRIPAAPTCPTATALTTINSDGTPHAIARQSHARPSLCTACRVVMATAEPMGHSAKTAHSMAQEWKVPQPCRKLLQVTKPQLTVSTAPKVSTQSARSSRPTTLAGAGGTRTRASETALERAKDECTLRLGLRAWPGLVVSGCGCPLSSRLGPTATRSAGGDGRAGTASRAGAASPCAAGAPSANVSPRSIARGARGPTSGSAFQRR